MATAELVRKNPFEVDDGFCSYKTRRNPYRKFTIALVGFAAYFVQNLRNDNDYQLGLIVLAASFLRLVF